MLNVLIKYPHTAIKYNDVQQTNDLEYHEQHQQSHHHPHHDVHVLRQASGPERAQDGRQSTHWASHSLAEACREMSHNFSDIKQVQDVHARARCLSERAPAQTVPFLTLRFLRSDFGEEWNLSHCDKRQTQNLQKHSDDELRQPPGKTAYKPEQKKKTNKHQLIMEFVIYFHIFLH